MDTAIKRAEKNFKCQSNDEDSLALVSQRARENSAHEWANLIYTGRMEGIEEVAKNMSLDLIAEITGLSMEEIKALQTKSNDKTH